MKSRAKTIMSGKGRGIGKKLGAFGRVISQHKKITALCSLLLFAGAFALIFSDTYKPSEAAAATRMLSETQRLTVAVTAMVRWSDMPLTSPK